MPSDTLKLSVGHPDSRKGIVTEIWRDTERWRYRQYRLTGRPLLGSIEGCQQTIVQLIKWGHCQSIKAE